MATTITYTVISTPAVGTVVNVSDSLPAPNISETFEINRVAAGQVPIGAAPAIFTIISSLAKAIGIDYNVFSLYTITIDLNANTVVVTALNPSSQFTLVSNTTAGAITIVINNDAPPSTFTIDAVALSDATVGDVCDDVKLTVDTTPQADNISSPIVDVVSANPYIFEAVRANEIDITMDESGIVTTVKARIPLLLTAYINIDITGTPSGGIIIVERLYPLSQTGDYPLLLTFQYKMDIGGVYQVANSWSGISEGAHTVYIKDNIGCEISIPITVPAFSANLVDFDALVEVSNAGSMRWKLNEIWDNECGILKSVQNTLSFEEETKINHRNYLQPFQKCDTPQTQIKSNYDTHVAKLYDCDGEVETLSVVQMTLNMDVKDVRDGKVKELDGGVLGIYFGSGNTYDPDTLIKNDSYNLLESLMDWVNVGDYMSVEGIGWAKITEIIPPATDFPFYIVSLATTNLLNYADDTVLKITTIYNVVDYDRFEFEIDLSSREGNYYVKINATDASFTAKEFISEWINVQTVHLKHHKMVWYSTKNNELNYGTGITNIARFPYVMQLKWKPDSEQEIYVTDTNTINLDSKVREFYDLNLLPMPTAMAQKVVLLLAHNRVFIDGVSYLLEGEVDSKPIGTTNTNYIKATLVRTDYVFTNTAGTTAGEILLGSGVPLQIGADGLLFIE